ncbi:LuxR C-terminal-related transcriptional regulator [Gaiella sp.]|uniref:helix-turn-helix transcriptional regulator n=1 Tax=Gaiella sp. TaxID=2663207 RepID=UPI003266F9BA
MSGLKRELHVLGTSVESAVEEMAVPAGLFDADGVILWQNAASLALWGSRIGTNFAHLSGAEVQVGELEAFQEVVATGEPSDIWMQLTNVDGAPASIIMNIHALRDDNNTVVGALGITREASVVRRPAATVPGLTERHIEILRLLASGRATEEIASDLSLSPATVRNNIAKLMAVLDVHSRLQAVLAAGEAGLLDPELVGPVTPRS